MTSIISCNRGDLSNNPLVNRSQTPYDTPEFSKIRAEHYQPAVEYALKQARSEADAIINSTEAPTFANTVEAMERSGQLLEDICAVLFNMLENETSEQLQQVAEQVQPAIIEFGNDINLNPVLFARVKAVYDDRANLTLDTEQAKLLEDTYINMVRGGAGLNDADKEKYRQLSTELATLSLTFGNNVLSATNAFTLNITDSTEVAELPEFVRESLAEEAKARGQQGWTVTLQAATMVPFMTYSSNRGYKEQLWRAYNTRCLGDENDNTTNVKRIAEVRRQLAALFGFECYADYSLERTMAETTATVDAFLEELLVATKSYAVTDYERVNNYARTEGADYEVQSWDWAYWNEKYKNAFYSLNAEEIKPYFELENTKQGIFKLAEMLYGITFTPNDQIEVYNPDVKVYEVKEADGTLIGILYMDFFPRATKSGGAWMTSFREEYVDAAGDKHIPLVSMCGNFTKPTSSTPSLLTFDEFETFLHEFGHCLHGLFAEGKYGSLTGTSVYRDFVELPSQIMENWATEPEYLDIVARHYQTGEKMPAELIDKIIAAKNYLAAYANVRQLSFGMNDMAFHTVTAPIEESVVDFECNATRATRILPYVEGTAMAPSFTHIFSGGYAAGYYSYKWAEVLEADAFALFKEKGIFNREVAQSFRDNVLSRGGTEHPMDLYLRFRGHKPETKALIDRITAND